MLAFALPPPLERASVDAQHGFRLNGICAGCEVERTAGDINIPLIGFFRIVGLNGVCTGCDSKRTSGDFDTVFAV